MMHHDYPLPPKEIQDLIENARKAERSDASIAAELKGRGLTDDEIGKALAPGATVVAIAESSVEMIEHHSPGQIWAYGLFLGFPSALMMIRFNSVELRGQDKMLGRVRKYAIAYGVWLVAAVAALAGIAVSGQAVPPFAVGAALFVANAAFAAYAATVSMRAQKPFHDDAAKRDEIAPASVMVPLLAGIGHDLALYALVPYLISSIR